MIRIVTDTASDITLAAAQNMDIELVAVNVAFGDEPFVPTTIESFELFYEKLAECKMLPVTSQPSPAVFLSIFEAAKAANDEVIAILLSSNLSGTVQAANIAKEMSDYSKITIIDSKLVTAGQRLLVDLAVKMRAEGKTADEIITTIEDTIPRVRLFGALDTLKYLRKGGRIPKSAEMLGTLMGIKPLITIDEEGTIAMAGKMRGHAGAVTGMVKLIDEHPRIDRSVPVYFGYTGDAHYARNFQKLARTKYHLLQTQLVPVGAVVGTHIGPGAFAITYLEEKIHE